jgi:L-alanine-DL-glutamate epimerase-like enolase superfamily enzyme
MACRIVSVDHELLDLELTEPFGIAGGQHELARLALVRVRLEDGSEGLGEAAPLPAYNGETIEGATRAIELSAPALVGLDARRFRRCAEVIRPLTADSAAARCALETALADALCHHLGLPLASFFGGAESGSLQTGVTIPIVPNEAARAAAEARWAQGFRKLKVKLGGLDDVGRVLAVFGGAPEAGLILDANGGLSATRASELVATLARHGVAIELFEQPAPADDWRGLCRVAERCRVALDESVTCARDALLAAERLGPPHVINVKLMKSGIVEALDIASVARGID